MSPHEKKRFDEELKRTLPGADPKLARLGAFARATGRRSEPVTNLVDCAHCDGTGKVEQTCNGCGKVLTAKTVAAPFGTEGDDVCKACEKADEEWESGASR